MILTEAFVEYFISILLTVMGAILGQLLAKFDIWRQTSGRGDLCGRWFSASHAGDKRLVFDEISVKKRFGKFYIKNKGNDFGYDFECFCVVENINTIAGHWRSIRPGSTARGNVLLLVNPQGDLLMGCYSGQDDSGSHFLFGWVMARDSNTLQGNLHKLKNKIIY